MPMDLQVIQRKIYVRGQRVMLDFELAAMYSGRNTYFKPICKTTFKAVSSRFHVSAKHH